MGVTSMGVIMTEFTFPKSGPGNVCDFLY